MNAAEKPIDRWTCAEGDGGAEMWRDSEGEYLLHSDHVAALSAAEERERVLREALKECRIVLVVDNEYDEGSQSVLAIDAALATAAPEQPSAEPPTATIRIRVLAEDAGANQSLLVLISAPEGVVYGPEKVLDMAALKRAIDWHEIDPSAAESRRRMNPAVIDAISKFANTDAGAGVGMILFILGLAVASRIMWGKDAR